MTQQLVNATDRPVCRLSTFLVSEQKHSGGKANRITFPGIWKYQCVTFSSRTSRMPWEGQPVRLLLNVPDTGEQGAITKKMPREAQLWALQRNCLISLFWSQGRDRPRALQAWWAWQEIEESLWRAFPRLQQSTPHRHLQIHTPSLYRSSQFTFPMSWLPRIAWLIRFKNRTRRFSGWFSPQLVGNLDHRKGLPWWLRQ